MSGYDWEEAYRAAEQILDALGIERDSVRLSRLAEMLMVLRHEWTE